MRADTRKKRISQGRKLLKIPLSSPPSCATLTRRKTGQERRHRAQDRRGDSVHDWLTDGVSRMSEGGHIGNGEGNEPGQEHGVLR